LLLPDDDEDCLLLLLWFALLLLLLAIALFESIEADELGRLKKEEGFGFEVCFGSNLSLVTVLPEVAVVVDDDNDGDVDVDGDDGVCVEKLRAAGLIGGGGDKKVGGA
jgi:hypothetical protein